MQDNGWWTVFIRKSVSGLYVIFPLAYFVYKTYIGESVDSLIFFIMVVFIMVSGYTIYKEKMFDKAVDTAQEITESATSDGEKDDA